MKRINFIIFLLLTFITISAQKFREGDIVFQISKSSQSKYIQLATMSPWSHCGIVIIKDNKIYVLEAANVVKLTPINTWINKGRFKIYKKRRITNKPIKIKYQKYLGKKYDLEFKFNNGKYYCSELVYDIYKSQFNIKLATPKSVKSYYIFGIINIINKRNITKNQLVITPSDLL